MLQHLSYEYEYANTLTQSLVNSGGGKVTVLII